MGITSVKHAHTLLSQASFAHPSWFDGTTDQNMAKFIYCYHEIGVSIKRLVRAYLTNIGDNPKQYGL